MNSTGRRRGKSRQDKARFPLVVMDYRGYSPISTTELQGKSSRYARDRSYIPYQAGDVVFINIATVDEPNIQLARVIATSWEYLEARGHSVPRYRVRTLTMKGYWSSKWRYVFPGHIRRAYFADADGKTPRGLPSEVSAGWTKRGFSPVGEPNADDDRDVQFAGRRDDAADAGAGS